MWEDCEGVVNEYWHDCYWYAEGCDAYNGIDEPEVLPDVPSDHGADMAHDGQPGERFQDWIECYEYSYDQCDEDYTKHSEFYDCYWYGEQCEDDYWYTCHWELEEGDCDVLEGNTSEFNAGFVEGYESGYMDAMIDHVPQPRDNDMSEFHMEMVIQSFENWVQEQEQRQGRFHCGHDIRLDFPFDDSEYMALWAAHDCADWDLYLTVVADGKTGDNALAYTGAEPSERRGCYETVWFEDVGACEFYLPHGGDNFGMLFAGGFHAVWHEYEWEYNPGWESWFGDW
jgi:hypothetical protein